MDRAPLAVDTRKAIAVLAVLAIETTATRDTLASMLWPDSDPSRARGALRRTLSVLTAGLGVSHPLTVDRRTLRLDPGAAWIDLGEARELARSTEEHGHAAKAVCPACVTPLSTAVELHRGEFMQDFALREVPDFDDWQTRHAEALRRELTRDLERLTRATVDADDLDATGGHLLRWLEVDPLNEQVHGRLMLLHAWRGERTEAIRRYRECVALLHRELGVAPLPRTTRLYQAVLEGRVERSVTPATPPSVSSPAPVVTPPVPSASDASPGPARFPDEPSPFVGRGTELERLQAALAPGQVVTVRGEAGVGRSRLVEEAALRLRAAGRSVLVGRCHPGEHAIAYAAVVDLLHAVLAEPGAPERVAALPVHQLSQAARLLPELLELREGVLAPEPLELPGAHARFLDALVHVIAALGTPSAVPVLVVEDLHVADAATLDVLSYAARRLPSLGLTLLLTWRADASPASSVLQRCLAEPSVAERVDAFVLDRFTAAETHALCRALLGSRDDLDVMAVRIHEEAAGLPLAVIEYARELTDSELTIDDPWPVPPGLRELVRSRIAELSETARQLAGAAALFGARFELDTLRAAAGRTEEETVAGLEELLGCGLLTGADDGTFGFGHDRMRSVVAEDLTPVRRRSLHGRIVEALELRARRPRGAGLAAVIADHARRAGREVEAARWALAAGDHARTIFAHDDALTHYEAALASGHPEPHEVHRRIAQLRVLLGEYRAALQAYELAAAHAHDPRSLAVIEHELAGVHLRRGDLHASRGHLDVALDLLVEDSPLRARVLADLALTELHDGNLDTAAEFAACALRVAEANGDAHAIAQARNVAGLAARRSGAARDALRHLEHAAAIAAGLQDPAPHVAALNNLALTSTDLGEVERAEELFERAIERCTRLGDRHRQAALRNNLADLLHAQGREEESRTHQVAAMGLFAEIGDAPNRTPEIWQLASW